MFCACDVLCDHQFSFAATATGSFSQGIRASSTNLPGGAQLSPASGDAGQDGKFSTIFTWTPPATLCTESV
eukprot:36785-Eustigmatos_ZCMA.PRE.1